MQTETDPELNCKEGVSLGVAPCASTESLGSWRERVAMALSPLKRSARGRSGGGQGHEGHEGQEGLLRHSARSLKSLFKRSASVDTASSVNY